MCLVLLQVCCLCKFWLGGFFGEFFGFVGCFVVIGGDECRFDVVCDCFFCDCVFGDIGV